MGLHPRPNLYSVDSDDEDNEHNPDPKPGTWKRKDTGQPADFFTSVHYPIKALCRICLQPIEAESFLKPFVHVPDNETSTG